MPCLWIYIRYIEYNNYHRHDDVIKWKHFSRYWSFVRGIPRSPVNTLHKGQWRRALMFSLICVWINGWENNSEPGDLRRHRARYDVIDEGERKYPSKPWRCSQHIPNSFHQRNCVSYSRQQCVFLVIGLVKSWNVRDAAQLPHGGRKRYILVLNLLQRSTKFYESDWISVSGGHIEMFRDGENV